MNSKQLSKKKHKYRHWIIDDTWHTTTVGFKETTNDIGAMFANDQQTYVSGIIKNCPDVLLDMLLHKIIGMTVLEAGRYYKTLSKQHIAELKLEALLTKNF